MGTMQVEINGKSYTLTSLTVTEFCSLADLYQGFRQRALAGQIDSAGLKELFSEVSRLVHCSIQRAHPDVTADEIAGTLSVCEVNAMAVKLIEVSTPRTWPDLSKGLAN
jgi:hypothetical protein